MSCQFHTSTNRAPGYYSSCIEVAKAFAINSDYVVVIEDLPVQGRIRYEKKQIVLNEPCAGCAVLVLLHEIGHMILEKEYPESCSDETAADVMGKIIGRKLGFDLEEDWEYELANHREKHLFQLKERNQNG